MSVKHKEITLQYYVDVNTDLIKRRTRKYLKLSPLASVQPLPTETFEAIFVDDCVFIYTLRKNKRVTL